MRLKGRVALIAGGAGSMGSAVARLFAQEGAAVCVADRDEDRAQETARKIAEAGGRAMAVALDVCDAQAWTKRWSQRRRHMAA
ncbi:MAG: SDR family NAD(P)-dependent oxidoreductase [Candidatus Latescibacterota bacterium]